MTPIEELEALEAAVNSNSTLSRIVKDGRQFSEAPRYISAIFADLDTVQRRLFTTLVERYEIYSDIGNYAFDISKSLIPVINFGAKLQIITPYIEIPKKPKSGIGFAYEVRAAINAEGIDDRKFKTLSTIPENIEADAQYVMIDDYAGSGRTILLAVMEMLQRGARLDQINVNVFYIMRDAISKMEAIGLKVAAKIVASKSLTGVDFSAFGFNGDQVAVYDSIESKVNISPAYSRGYEGTESLVTFKKTPNNTLPIFWASKRTGGGRWPAPFPR